MVGVKGRHPLPEGRRLSEGYLPSWGSPHNLHATRKPAEPFAPLAGTSS